MGHSDNQKKKFVEGTNRFVEFTNYFIDLTKFVGWIW